jgi:hypothetical protein
MLKIIRKKVAGDLDVAHWKMIKGVPVYCKCGCRLRTDTKIDWCSNPKCFYFKRSV